MPPAPEETATVDLQRVSRWYGPVIGLNDISLQFHPGVTGLLGPNGAGKSTLLKLVTGQLRPSQGKVRVFGHRVFANPRVLSRIGMSPEHDDLYEHWSGRQHVEFLLQVGGFKRREARQMAVEVLERVGLSDAAERRAGTYSKGMRQRLRLAQATAHDPQLIVLDEPLTGLDPVGRRDVIDYVRDLGGRGRTIIVSGHVLYEVEKMTRRIALIHHGRMLAEGTIHEIRKALDQRPHHVRVGTSAPREVARRLLEVEGVVSVAIEDHSALIETVDPEVFFDKLMEVAAEGKVDVQRYEGTDDNLQAVFDYLVA